MSTGQVSVKTGSLSLVDSEEAAASLSPNPGHSEPGRAFCERGEGFPFFSLISNLNVAPPLQCIPLEVPINAVPARRGRGAMNLGQG